MNPSAKRKRKKKRRKELRKRLVQIKRGAHSHNMKVHFIDENGMPGYLPDLFSNSRNHSPYVFFYQQLARLQEIQFRLIDTSGRVIINGNINDVEERLQAYIKMKAFS